MTDNSLTDSITAHVAHILELKSQLADVHQQIDNLQLKLRDAQAQQVELADEIVNAKKILDFCIEKGVDPIQAKLSYNTKEINQEVQDRLDSLDYRQKLFEQMVSSTAVQNIYHNTASSSKYGKTR